MAREHILLRWMRLATAEEKEQLAKGASTTVGALRQAANGYKSGGLVQLTAEFAARIETASIKVHRDGLPVLRRESLSKTCANCQHVAECKAK